MAELATGRGSTTPITFAPASSAESGISGGPGGISIGGINTGTQGAVPPLLLLGAGVAVLVVVLLATR